jgi:hypothetical protein
VTSTWYDFSSYAKFSSDRKSVTLTLRDGGPSDADGIANGVIVDPAGIGVGGMKKEPKAAKRWRVAEEAASDNLIGVARIVLAPNSAGRAG